jgi:hypothetical protein
VFGLDRLSDILTVPVDDLAKATQVGHSGSSSSSSLGTTAAEQQQQQQQQQPPLHYCH